MCSICARVCSIVLWCRGGRAWNVYYFTLFFSSWNSQTCSQKSEPCEDVFLHWLVQHLHHSYLKVGRMLSISASMQISIALQNTFVGIQNPSCPMGLQNHEPLDTQGLYQLPSGEAGPVWFHCTSPDFSALIPTPMGFVIPSLWPHSMWWPWNRCHFCRILRFHLYKMEMVAWPLSTC